MDVQTISAAGLGAPSGRIRNQAAALGGTDFLNLLIAQLQAQDPLEPMNNEQLLSQIATIRNMEMTTQLTTTLEDLAADREFGAASGLIGRFVETDVAAGDFPGATVSGIVTAVVFDEAGRVHLQLDSGQSVPLERVRTVTTIEQAARSLVGLFVSGTGSDENGQPVEMAGIVQAVRVTESGEPVLVLEDGSELPLSGVREIRRAS